MRRSFRTAFGAVICALSLSACHTYVPVDTPVPGSAVRVVVPVRSAIDDPNAAGNTASFEGDVISVSRDTVVVAMDTRRDRGAFRAQLRQIDTVRLARAGVSSLELKEFSSSKSVMLGAAITGAVTVLALSALGVEGGAAGEGNPGDGGDVTGSLIPVRKSVSLVPVISAVFRLLGG